MGMTRSEQLSTAWVEDADHGGMLLAVLGHLGDADRDLLAGMAAAGDVGVRRGAGRRRPGTAPDRREPPATAALRSGGWKATTLERDGSLAAAWMELAR